VFTCPICGNNTYTKVLSEIFKCDRCSVLFGDPDRFGKKTNKQTQEVKTEVKTGNAHVFPGGIGAVVSAPIKLNRR